MKQNPLIASCEVCGEAKVLIQGICHQCTRRELFRVLMKDPKFRTVAHEAYDILLDIARFPDGSILFGAREE